MKDTGLIDGNHAAEVLGADRDSRWLVLCDHASNAVPDDVSGGDLGLPASEMERHIAYDIGAAGVARALADGLGCTAVLGRFSRLVVDPNRGEDDPTIIMQLYDRTIVPGNRRIAAGERARRIGRYYKPYHGVVAALAGRREDTVIVSVHSFTPRLIGRVPRPWHIGLLSADDRRLSDPLLDILAAERDLCVGDNEPYAGHLAGDTVDRHALQLGRPNVLIELRHDLIDSHVTQAEWGARLVPLLSRAATIAGV